MSNGLRLPERRDVRHPAGERRVLWHLVVGDGCDGDEDLGGEACLVRLEQGRATLDALYD
jgi:hypothetical protein